MTVTRSRPRILKDLLQATTSAAAAALLLLTGCSSGEASLRPDVDSLRAEIRTLQRENGDLVRRVEAMGTQLDVLAARSATAAAAAPLVPAHLTVVRLPQPKAPPFKAQKSPAVPTSTPIQEPSTTALAALGSGGKALGAESQAVLDAARAQAGLPRARALEMFTDRLNTGVIVSNTLSVVTPHATLPANPTNIKTINFLISLPPFRPLFFTLSLTTVY